MYLCQYCGEVFDEPTVEEEKDVGYHGLSCPGAARRWGRFRSWRRDHAPFAAGGAGRTMRPAGRAGRTPGGGSGG